MLKYIEFGNLTGRLSDGVFQVNVDSNAFFKKIMSIIELHILPKEIQNLIIDFTPIDLVSTAICKLMLESKDTNIIYHLYNSKTMTMEQLISLLNKIGFNIGIFNIEDIRALSKDKRKQIDELMLEIYPTINKMNITIYNTITDELLKSVGFEWQPIDKKYLLKTINYVRKGISSNYENNVQNN